MENLCVQGKGLAEPTACLYNMIVMFYYNILYNVYIYVYIYSTTCMLYSVLHYCRCVYVTTVDNEFKTFSLFVLKMRNYEKSMICMEKMVWRIIILVETVIKVGIILMKNLVCHFLPLWVQNYLRYFSNLFYLQNLIIKYY